MSPWTYVLLGVWTFTAINKFTKVDDRWSQPGFRLCRIVCTNRHWAEQKYQGYIDTNFLVSLRPGLGSTWGEPPRKYDCLPYPEFSDHSWLRLWQWHVYAHRIPQSSMDHDLLSGVDMRDRESHLIQTNLCFLVCFRFPAIYCSMPCC